MGETFLSLLSLRNEDGGRLFECGALMLLSTGVAARRTFTSAGIAGKPTMVCALDS